MNIELQFGRLYTKYVSGLPSLVLSYVKGIHFRVSWHDGGLTEGCPETTLTIKALSYGDVQVGPLIATPLCREKPVYRSVDVFYPVWRSMRSNKVGTKGRTWLSTLGGSEWAIMDLEWKIFNLSLCNRRYSTLDVKYWSSMWNLHENSIANLIRDFDMLVWHEKCINQYKQKQ